METMTSTEVRPSTDSIALTPSSSGGPMPLLRAPPVSTEERTGQRREGGGEQNSKMKKRHKVVKIDIITDYAKKEGRKNRLQGIQ